MEPDLNGIDLVMRGHILDARGGRPRVSGDVPLRFQYQVDGLRHIIDLLPDDDASDQWKADARLCRKMLRLLLNTCKSMQALGRGLEYALETEATDDRGRREVERIRERIAAG